MIAFENDDRTRGEQLVLRWMLRGNLFPGDEWSHLRPGDFAHDLHGRIFRHASELIAKGIMPAPVIVYGEMRSMRYPRVLDGVAEYLEWLPGDGPADSGNQMDALTAFYEASLDQHRARMASKQGHP